MISSLHPNLHFPPSLVHLDLSANRTSLVFCYSISVLVANYQFTNPAEIEILHPAHFSRANFVRILHLSDNQLFDIEEEMFIGQLRRLEVSSVSAWCLMALLSECCYCERNQQLHVCGNELVALPESIGRRRWLKVLNIARNKVRFNLKQSDNMCVMLLCRLLVYRGRSIPCRDWSSCTLRTIPSVDVWLVLVLYYYCCCAAFL